MGTIYKQRKSRFLWIKFYRDGRPIRESTRTEKESEARRILRQREGDVAAGRPVLPRADRVRFEELADDLLNDYRVNRKRSLDRAERSAEHLRSYFGGWRAVNITTPAIRAYIDKRQQEGAKNATINRELAALKRMFSLAIAAEKLLRKPRIPTLQEDNVRKGFFEPDQFVTVLKHLPKDLKSVMEVAYITGWRIKSEILTRQISHLDLRAGWLRLDPGETKNREGRMFPLTPELRNVLKRQLARTRTMERTTGRIIPWLFHRQGRPIKSFRRAWLTACMEAGVPGRIPHDFRRTAVRNLERAGVPRSAAMAMVGHKTEAIYRRYAIVDEAMLREAAAKLAARPSRRAAVPNQINRLPKIDHEG